MSLCLVSGASYIQAASYGVHGPDTVLVGLGFPTLIPDNGIAPMTVASVPGAKISALLFDAGPVTSPVLLHVGDPRAGPSGESS